MYHPDATPCVLPLQNLGYTLLEKPTPVNVSDIQGQELRERIVNNGCCGEVCTCALLMCIVCVVCVCLTSLFVYCHLTCSFFSYHDLILLF